MNGSSCTGRIEKLATFAGTAAAERFIARLLENRAAGRSDDVATEAGIEAHAEAERHCVAMAIDGASGAEVCAYREAHRAALEHRLAVFTADANAITAISEAFITRLQGDVR